MNKRTIFAITFAFVLELVAGSSRLFQFTLTTSRIPYSPYRNRGSMIETAATTASAGAFGKVATRNLARNVWGLLLLTVSQQKLVIGRVARRSSSMCQEEFSSILGSLLEFLNDIQNDSPRLLLLAL